ncbi:prolactin receptor [Merluccius polli]|uniref:Prolactin receptor n=1 Tax=Merluccius polli TaxID=89951 RepID=A0AA47M445_MERPO|nr:prolactin receptor [Merluccius polli]
MRRAAGAALLLLALVFKAAAAETGNQPRGSQQGGVRNTYLTSIYRQTSTPESSGTQRYCGFINFNLLSFLLFSVPQDFGPPGKPTLTSCLSRDKETFTCWWKPSEEEEEDDDDGLQTATSYSLYYRKENSDVAYECPDYRSAGGNSCYFNKNNTSIWVNYNITVVASNARGSSASEPVVVDVAYIGEGPRPHTPENVTVSTLEDKEGTFFRVSWEPPRKADTRSGWITLVYELRATLDGAEWEEHYAGQQKMFNMFGLRPGGVYLVQVRCKPIHGFWSEWSPPVNVTAPDAVPQVRSTWLLVAVFSALAFLVLTFILNVKSSRVKRCLFPPVPGPKIRGLDIQLLKNGRSEDVLSALAVPGFPPAAARNCDYENLLVYLEVGGPEEQELTLTAAAAAAAAEGPKSSQGAPPSDSDSGRGSCDSRTLLMEKCGEGEAAKEEEERGDGETEAAAGGRRRSRGEKRWWESRASWEKKKKTEEEEEQEEEEEEEQEEDASAGRVKTWPSVFVPPDAYAGSKALGAAKQLCYSDRSLPPPPPPLSPSMTSSSSNSSSPSGRQACSGGGGGGGYSTCEEPRAGLRCQERLRWQPYSRSELSIHSLELIKHRQQQQQQQQGGGRGERHRSSPAGPAPLSPPGHGRRAGGRRVAAAAAAAAPPGEEDYSRVKGLNCGDVPLLQGAADVETEEGEEREEEEEEEHPCDMPSREGCYTAPPAVPSQTAGAGKPSVRPPPAASLREDAFLAANGYVDTAAAMTPTY